MIDSLIKRYPQLKVNSGSDAVGYDLIRTVSFGKPAVTIKLYSQPDSVDDKQKILLVTNCHSRSYAIPLFSNTYQGYWNFQFDKVMLYNGVINTTFEKELNVCLETLGLNDTVGKAGLLVDEMLYSLFHCRDVRLCDSSDFTVLRLSSKNSVPEEDDHTCFERITRNWEMVSKEMGLGKYIVYKHAYWDKENNRVYQFDFENFKRKKKNYFKLNTFRQDCNQHLITL